MKTLFRVAVLLFALTPSFVRADSTGRDAARHFQRGVDLYNDGDFRGALVEFKRAYTLLPRANVLYDIGETEFQLQDYATAFVTMKRFLAETGASAAHRSEVEATVETLAGRVGKIALTTDTARCDVTIDELPTGSTPQAEPVLVSVGVRKLVVSCPQRAPITRRVEVAAGEVARVEVLLGPAPVTGTLPLAMVSSSPPPPSPRAIEQRRVRHLALVWSATAILGAATIGVGAATLAESSHLDGLRHTYPTTTSALDRAASLTHGLSIAADVLGAATLAALGVSTYVTIRDRKERGRVILGFAPSSVSGKF
jgi:hypothetical protein